jgi:general secretion pathway protein J
MEREDPRARAFTLIELLIAVAIFAIVLAAINGVLYGALRLRTQTARVVEESLPVQQTVAILKRDLQGIVAPGGVLAGALKSGLSGSSMDQQETTEIYTGTGMMDDRTPWADVQKVAYYLRDPTNQTSAGRDLVRAVTRNLLAPIQEQPGEQWLMGDVERLAFFFYSGTEWRSSWDSTTEESVLPKAIKVQIDLASTGRNQRRRTPVEIVVPIVAQVRTNQATGATGGQP